MIAKALRLPACAVASLLFAATATAGVAIPIAALLPGRGVVARAIIGLPLISPPLFGAA